MTDIADRIRATQDSISTKAAEVFGNQRRADSQGRPAPRPEPQPEPDPVPEGQGSETGTAEDLHRTVAAEKGLSDGLAALLTGSTYDEVIAQADALIEHVPPATPPGSFDGGARPGLGERVTLDTQIAAAESAGDTKLAIRLKTQKFGEAVRRQRAMDVGAVL